MQQLSILLIALFTSISLTAQVGEIKGKVKDMEMDGIGLPFAYVYVEVDSIPRSTSTDMDGFYSIKPLASGTYKVTVEYVGYERISINNIIVKANESTFVDFEMKEAKTNCYSMVSYYYSIPPYTVNEPTEFGLTGKDIQKQPTIKIEDNIKLTPGVFGEF